MAQPIWILCPDCGDYFCVKHGKHTFDCECPPIDEMKEDPYGMCELKTEDKKKIEYWDVISDPMGLVAFITTLWNNDYGSILVMKHKPPGETTTMNNITLFTGGWHDNEEIVNALQCNGLWWAHYWMASQRGGTYYFRVHGG